MHGEGTGYSREYIRESVLAWGARKWPDLFCGRNEFGPDDFETELASSQVQVASTGAGGFSWSFRGVRPDASANRLWETRVLFLGQDRQDLLFVSTGYRGEFDPEVVVAQPGFVCGLVDHLAFEDGGYRLGTVPREVHNDAAFAGFREHLSSPHRTTPVLVLGSAPASSESRIWEESGLVDACSVARRLCGLAHVVCLGPLVLLRLEDWLGSVLAVSVGHARLFMPGLDDRKPEVARHPGFVPPKHGTSSEAAADLALVVESAVCAWSVSAPRRHDFEALWLARAGATR